MARSVNIYTQLTQYRIAAIGRIAALTELDFLASINIFFDIEEKVFAVFLIGNKRIQLSL